MPQRFVLPYLTALRHSELGALAETMVAAQCARDHNRYHVTVISPVEMTDKVHLDIENLKGLKPEFNIFGLGTAARAEKRAVYIIVESKEVQALRQKFFLPRRDLHITLGFMGDDVHDVVKNRSTELIKV